MTVVLVVFVGLWIFDKLKAVFQAKKEMERRLQDRMGGETRALITWVWLAVEPLALL
jgi:FPC/CPF motif-containing protein YcgG